jgi:phytoene dehydrogenase-like protein
MIPSPDIDVAVIGGGLAGLVAAATAASEPGARRRVVLFEPHPLGGRARCDARNGYVFNRGPRALYLGGAARPILDALGVDTSAGGPPATRGALGRHGGRLVVLPTRPVSAVRSRLLTTAGKVRLARAQRTLLATDPASVAGTAFTGVLAALDVPPPVAELLATVARVATYCADLDLADGGAVLGNVQLALGGGVRYLDGGFQTVVDQLAAIAVRRGVEIRPIPVDAVDDDHLVVHTVAGPVRAGAIVVAAGTPATVAALTGRPVEGVDRVSPPVTAACFELGLRRPPRHRVVLGVDEPLYLSTHCPPAALAPAGHAVVHVMRYHHRDEALDAFAQRALLHAAARQAGVEDGDVVEERFLPHMTVTGGMPLAAGGGLAGRPPVASPDRPGVLLAGDWVGDAGLLSDAAVASGHAAGRAAARRSATMMVA